MSEPVIKATVTEKVIGVQMDNTTLKVDISGARGPRGPDGPQGPPGQDGSAEIPDALDGGNF